MIRISPDYYLTDATLNSLASVEPPFAAASVCYSGDRDRLAPHGRRLYSGSRPPGPRKASGDSEPVSRPKYAAIGVTAPDRRWNPRIHACERPSKYSFYGRLFLLFLA